MKKQLAAEVQKKTVRKKQMPKLPAVVERIVWKPLNPADCIQSIKTAAHLSSRSVNTNAAPVGIRIASEKKLELPVVSVCTLGADIVPVDYVSGAAQAGTLKQIVSVLSGVQDVLYEGIQDGQVAMILGLRENMQISAINGGEVVDPRLRQILVPGAKAAWVALTPLQSNGLSHVIATRLRAEAAASVDTLSGRNTIFRANAVFGIGGSNFQNVGRHARDMQRPLVFMGPTEDKAVRTAYAIHFSGHLRDGRLAPKKETLAFALWRHGLTQGNARAMPTSMAIRQLETDHIHAIAAAAIAAANGANALLMSHRASLDALTSTDLDPFLRALIDPSLRDRNFKKSFAQKLIRSIERFEFKVGSGTHVVGGDGDLASLISVVEEVSL